MSLLISKQSIRSILNTIILLTISLVVTILLIACSMEEKSNPIMNLETNEDQAEITAVSYTGQPNNYTLSVTIQSPDTGCDQYADWWEVITAEGVLIYRRILGHSHVAEQPFTRTGGIVDIGLDDFIYVRAHMNNLGYGTRVFSGTLRNDLKADTLDANFAILLASTDPLPGNCAF